MAVNYSTAAKNARLTAVVNLLGTAGVLVIGTSALAGATGLLVSIPLANPGATVANGVLTVAGVPRQANATGAGTAALAELRDSAGTVIVSGLTVGLAASGADVIIHATAVSVGQTVQCTAGTITHS